MLVPMRTMPLWLASSVDVVSTDRAQRRQRSTSTETTGLADAFLLRRPVEPDRVERSESDDEYDDEEEALP